MIHAHSVLVHKFEFSKQLVVVPQRHHTFRRRIEALPLTNFQLDAATELLNSKSAKSLRFDGYNHRPEWEQEADVGSATLGFQA
ncbi:unnamed protein product, partial [Ceratitis capitata]